MKSFALIFLCLSLFSKLTFGSTCPDLSGKFLCPPWKTQPEYILYVAQINVGETVVYSHFYSFAETLYLTRASVQGAGEGDGVCEDNKLIISKTENVIGENGNYQAFVNGKKVIECKRL